MYAHSHTLKHMTCLLVLVMYGGIIAYPLQTRQHFREEIHCRWGRSDDKGGNNRRKWNRNYCRTIIGSGIFLTPKRVVVKTGSVSVWESHVQYLVLITGTKLFAPSASQVAKFLHCLNSNVTLTYSCHGNIGMYGERQPIHSTEQRMDGSCAHGICLLLIWGRWGWGLGGWGACLAVELTCNWYCTSSVFFFFWPELVSCQAWSWKAEYV